MFLQTRLFSNCMMSESRKRSQNNKQRFANIYKSESAVALCYLYFEILFLHLLFRPSLDHFFISLSLAFPLKP